MEQAYTTLEELGTALRRQIELSAVFTSINTRLIIQTGVNLKKVRPEQNADPHIIHRVQRALSGMGIRLEGQHG